MLNVADYAARLEQATSTASGYLSSTGYVNPISKKPLYSVKSVLPGVDDVGLTLEGTFEVATRGTTEITELGLNPSSKRNVKPLLPKELIDYVVEAARQQGNVMPSYIRIGRPLEEQIEGLLELLVHEIEVLPEVVELERQGRLSETKELLRVRR